MIIHYSLLKVSSKLLSNNLRDLYKFHKMLLNKKMFAETKAHARAIDLELRHMEVQQAQQHVQYLVSYMPDSFLSRGGDNDAVMLVLLMPRLLAKCDVLLSQLRDKYPPVENIEKATLGHPVQQFAVRSRFSMHIHVFQAILRQFVHGLNTCSPETLLKAGASYSDIQQKENVLDTYIDMLKKDQLDENVNTESLERAVVFMKSMLKTLLLETNDVKILQGQWLGDLGKAILSGIDSINTDALTIQVIVQEGSGGEPLVGGGGAVRGWCEALKSQIRQLKRKSDLPNLFLDPNTDLFPVCNTIAKLAKLLSDTAKTLGPVLPSDSDTLIPLEKFVEVISQNYEKSLDSEKDETALVYVRKSMDAICNYVANITLTLQENEDAYSAVKQEKKPIETPLALRAKEVKGELNAVVGMKKRLENKEVDIKELKLTLRSKQEELAEMILRRDIAEKKLANIVRDHELTVDSLKRKLDEAQQTLKRKEKEFEETMDHLQKDIDSLEMEKGELKEKLKLAPKKTSMDIMKSSPTGSISDIAGTVKVVESTLLINEIRYLRNLVEQERHQRLRLQAKDYHKVLDHLGPIHVLKKPSITDEENRRINELTKKAMDLRQDMLKSLPKVIDISKKKPGDKSNLYERHLINEWFKTKHLKNRMTQLQDEVMNEVISQKQGGHIRTAIGAVFATPELVNALTSTAPAPLFEITLPTSDPKLSGKTVPIQVDMKELEYIKGKMFAY